MSRHGAKSRYNFQRDKNEQPIIDALEARGFCITQINGRGVPDLLVGFRGTTLTPPQMWLVEVKQPKGKLNPNQVKWRERWTGPAPILVRSVEEALLFPVLHGHVAVPEETP